MNNSCGGIKADRVIELAVTSRIQMQLWAGELQTVEYMNPPLT